MAKTTAASGVDPFASAKRRAPAGGKKAESNIIVAKDFTAYNGGVFSKADVVGAIENFCDGHQMFEEGKAMKDAARPTVLYLARTEFAKTWLMSGKRPVNPKVVTKEDGGGRSASVIFQDSSNNLDDEGYASLANMIGARNAEEVTTRRDEFTFNPELLEEKVKVAKDGKVVEQTVMDAIKEALQAKFSPSPEVLANLFTIKEVWKTNKGLIDKGLGLVTSGKSPADAARLAEFLDVGRFTTQIKPGAGGGE